MAAEIPFPSSSDCALLPSLTALQISPYPSPDWARLPSLAVQLVSEQLKSITDLVRFRAVCPSWRSALPSKPRHLPPQVPWLMVPYNPHKDKNPNDDSIRLFYDLSRSKIYKIHLAETRHMLCCAASKGWLLLVAEEGKEVLLLNPLTREKITLPNFITPVNIFGIEGATYDAHYWFVPYIGNFVINKVVFSSDPSEPGCIIMVFLQKTCRIFFCRVGDPCWTLVNQDPEEIRTEKASDATFYNNKFYLLAHDGVLRVYDLNDPKNELCCEFLPEFQSYRKYLLEGKAGVYLAVIHGSRSKEEESGDEDAQGEDGSGDEEESSEEEETKKALELYQIMDPEMQLKLIKNTTNTCIFMGDNNDQYLAVRSDGWDSLKGDHLYMAAPCKPSDKSLGGEEDVPPCYGIFRASLEEGIGEKIAGDLGQRPALWPPAPALWFQPSLV